MLPVKWMCRLHLPKVREKTLYRDPISCWSRVERQCQLKWVVPNVGSATSFGNLATNINYMYNIANPVVGDKATSVMLEAAVVNSNAMITDFTIDGDSATLATLYP